jgi:hypothetical protein
VIGTARACTVRVVSESREDKGETGKARLSKVIKPHRSRSLTRRLELEACVTVGRSESSTSAFSSCAVGG